MNKAALIKKQEKHKFKEWKIAVRKCAEHRCEVCGKTGLLHTHHILPKERYAKFKTEVMNGILLCPNHHKYGKLSAHRNPIWFAKWLQDTFPDKYEWALSHLEV